ncbi:hypothetical protein CXG50_13820 [Pseudomonas plecoglossicida]|uniref:Uncharacterized protein n=1 Tax=Pseudomonas plecoglossicida TaxID=70775 RepID=A0ABX4U7N4_PSEDL|nr:hypothetical protein CSW00_00540 [Pseudomonas sp. MR 02]PLP89688.1 hypothetical protein CX682_17155 [Pseudomonas sp. FFUP_PS_41]PLU88633.1 hypothetical protein CXG44_02695 [Pseudomonas plecoglossicida]PLV02297.1 hypothetical protein CXG48_16925 [Pseudomonas plecoglossicida]PLV08685.1 hypothetical protein CXG50_13820 [Pseudomonas plecoglossicida]
MVDDGRREGIVGGLFWPYRRQASSHRWPTAFKANGVPVGAGLPAMRPLQRVSPAGGARQLYSASL